MLDAMDATTRRRDWILCIAALLMLSHVTLAMGEAAPFGQRRLAQAVTMGCMENPDGPAVTWQKARKVEEYYQPTNKNYRLARQSVYEGPLGHIGFCAQPLFGDPTIDACAVAVGRDFLDADHTPVGKANCNRCMCVRILDSDMNCNRYADPKLVEPVKGKTFKCQVKDQCPECEDSHIDILLDGVYAAADNVSGLNKLWEETNANWTSDPEYPGKNKRRPNSKYPIITAAAAKNVGVWMAEWIWADQTDAGCDVDCDTVFALNDGAQQQVAARRPGPRRGAPTSRPGGSANRPKAPGSTKPKPPASTSGPAQKEAKFKKPGFGPKQPAPKPASNPKQPAPKPASNPKQPAPKPASNPNQPAPKPKGPVSKSSKPVPGPKQPAPKPTATPSSRKEPAGKSSKAANKPQAPKPRAPENKAPANSGPKGKPKGNGGKKSTPGSKAAGGRGKRLLLAQPRV